MENNDSSVIAVLRDVNEETEFEINNLKEQDLFQNTESSNIKEIFTKQSKTHKHQTENGFSKTEDVEKEGTKEKVDRRKGPEKLSRSK